MPEPDVEPVVEPDVGPVIDLIVGLGQPDRGDDAVGPEVARAVAARRLPGVVVLERDEPADLMDTWAGHGGVLVVDAVRSGAAPGTLRVLDAGRTSGPLSPEAWAATGRGGTHALGLAAVVELARALGRLPDRVVVVGVEAERFDHGVPLSPAVAAAITPAADAVASALLALA
jgi:hydrogenase maturation protease